MVAQVIEPEANKKRDLNFRELRSILKSVFSKKMIAQSTVQGDNKVIVIDLKQFCSTCTA